MHRLNNEPYISNNLTVHYTRILKNVILLTHRSLDRLFMW